jgi:ABC-type dipeptide/oligopeptide/nickel transport system permease subunit
MAMTGAGVSNRAERADALLYAARPHRTLWRDALNRLIANRLALVGLAIIVLVTLMAILAPVISPYPYDKQDYTAISQFPTWTGPHPLGTDLVGRDMLSRMIWGAQVSIAVGLGSQLLVLLIGVPIGAIAGYFGGRVDSWLMRFVDVMYAFPQLLFVILIMAALGRGLQNIFIAIGITGWVTLARLTRAEFLALRERDFVTAARALGAGPWRLIFRHLLPNALSPIIVTVTFGIPQAIFTEAALSFIGIGINPPRPSWGQMAGEYQVYIQSYWYMSIFPSIAIALLMLAFTFFGDGLRDALDPRTRSSR